jgi:DNA-binding response OmpR family regulator
MVLLLDDDDDFRLALAANLIDDGHRVLHFPTPRHVPPLASLQGLTMLILDYQIQGEDGLSFADRFHDAHPDVPVVMVSAYRSEFLRTATAARGFVTLLTKPVDYEELARMLPLA